MEKITEQLLVNEIERLKSEIKKVATEAYNNGVNDGYRVEIHVAYYEGAKSGFTKEQKEEMIKNIKNQLNIKNHLSQ